MALSIGDEVPNFVQTSQLGDVNFYEYAGKSWVVFFSHPKDFTPVCATELAELAKMRAEFDKRNVKLLGLSVDKVEDHEAFIKDLAESQGVDIKFPVLADPESKIAHMFHMVHPKASESQSGKLTIRALYIIDPDKTIQLQMFYPAPTGRNFSEVLRCIDSLQLTSKHKVGTPANWQVGEDVVILPSVDDKEAKDTFPKGFVSVKPYLRLTPAPSK